jgi:glucose/arabinose dehydrogenase
MPCAEAADRDVPEGVTVRKGFVLSVVQADLKNPRFCQLGPDGTLYVSLPRAGQIKACRDNDGDGYYETITTFVDNYPSAHGMDWHDGELWFTQSGAVHRAVDRDNDGAADSVTTVLDDLPRGGHWWRSVLIHDGRLYTSIGDSGNITDETDTDRQKIWSYDLDGTDKTRFISGIRNTEKLVVRPGTDEIWGMDHGSDWFGKPVGDRRGKQPITDFNPPDEMNHYREGEFYGHPFIVGDKLPRYEYIDRDDIIDLADRTVVPEWSMPAHSACNAMCFYDPPNDATAAFADDHVGDAFVTMHGSWNRQNKSGYGVARVLFERGKPYGMLTYVSFLGPDRPAGRPVDVIVGPDGCLLISDDRANAIYRLKYVGDSEGGAKSEKGPGGRR